MSVSLALVAAMMRDVALQQCVRDAGARPAAYIARSFKMSKTTLLTGEHMTLAVATTGCLWRGQAGRVLIYWKTAHGYKQVLDGMSFTDQIEADEYGTITLPEHDTMNNIFEGTYVWNGNVYALSPTRSHIYDLSLAQRRPYQTAIAFASGASSMVLKDTAAYDFGEDYRFWARAGQRATIEILSDNPRPAVLLDFGENMVASLDRKRWSGTLPGTGTYTLGVFGTESFGNNRLTPYAIRLTIR